MGPTNRSAASRIFSWDIPLIWRCSITVPVASWVSVEIPKISSASYSLSPFKKNRDSLVARLRQQIKTPVANGSSVPVWPTFFAPKLFFIRATTPADEIPPGLSTTTIPFSSDDIVHRSYRTCHKSSVLFLSDWIPWKNRRLLHVHLLRNSWQCGTHPHCRLSED